MILHTSRSNARAGVRPDDIVRPTWERSYDGGGGRGSDVAHPERERIPIAEKSTRCILDAGTISEIIEMALSDSTPFATIQTIHGLSPDEVKALMRAELKPGSYRAWRKRVRQFSDRREIYK